VLRISATALWSGVLKTSKCNITIIIPVLLTKLFIRLVLLYRKLRHGYSFRRIPLSLGKFAIVDPEDYERLKRYKWYAREGPTTFYAVRYISILEKQDRKNAYMHNLVIDIPDGLFADHINYNGLDNRKANIRPATHTQNVWHRRKFRSNSTSNYIGVDWSKDCRKWRARIRYKGKRFSLGLFNSEIAAAKAYDAAARKFRKEFAVLNFPE